jgi:hypothetical protein
MEDGSIWSTLFNKLKVLADDLGLFEDEQSDNMADAEIEKAEVREVRRHII